MYKELGVEQEGVHQGINGDVVRNIDPGDHSFEFLHIVAKALVLWLG